MCMLLRTGGDELVTLTVPDRGRRGVTNAVGIDMRANVTDFELGEGDRILLCTDGVWENVDEAELCHVLQTACTPREAAVRAVIGRGNRDDATAVVLFADAGMD